MHKMKMKGTFYVQHLNKHGRLIGRYKLQNGIVTAGFNALLGIMFDGVTQIPTWYMGLINSGYTALQSTDIMSSHTGWTEFTTYLASTRPTFNPGSASNQQIASSSNTTFSINANTQLAGIFIVSNSAKGGTSGTLWSTGLFDSLKTVSIGDLFQVIYSLSGS